jgi:hypothetical protein
MREGWLALSEKSVQTADAGFVPAKLTSTSEQPDFGGSHLSSKRRCHIRSIGLCQVS